MISIRESVAELELSHRLRQTVFDCYVTSIRSIAYYAIDLEEAQTAVYRKHLEALADALAADQPAVLIDSRATLRALLRDYRDKAAQFIGELREDLANGTRALEAILKALAQSDGDHDGRLRASLRTLRELSDSPEGGPVRAALIAAADSIGQSVEEMRKQHELTITQLQVEIHMLHKRIDTLETAAMIDSFSKLFSRTEMEERIRTSGGEWFTLLLIRANGLTAAERQFNPAVAAELAGAFGKRLRNGLPDGAVIGRWSAEEFVAKTALPKREALAAAKWITENLSGAYSCLNEGKNVRPSLQVAVALADREAGETAERTLGRLAEFFKG
jgi:GGDEF domain-containing protein